MLQDQDLKKNVTDKGAWIHLGYLVLFSIVFYTSMWVVFLVSLFQFLAQLFSGTSFSGLREFGENLGTYQAQLSRYLSFASDEKPFPFAAFPSKTAE
jgi:hypothetical protein